MSEHTPECTYYRQVRPKQCICTEVKRAEQRVRDEIAADGPWFRSVVHQCCEDKQTAYVAGLDAAREALDALPTEQTVKEGVSEFWVEINHAIAAIDALREKPLASGGIYAGPSIPLGDGCVIPKSDAIDALREKP